MSDRDNSTDLSVTLDAEQLANAPPPTLSPVLTRAASSSTGAAVSGPVSTSTSRLPGVNISSSLKAIAQASAAKAKTRVRPAIPTHATAQEAAAASELLENLVARTNAYLETTVLSQDVNGGHGSSAPKSKKKRKGRMSEREEDQMLLQEFDHDKDGDGVVTHLTRQPATITGGEMRPYQVEGLNWLIRLYHGGISGILADEMGLGKTLQTISFLAYLKLYIKGSGPHMVIVPLSTLGNWVREFNRWCPSLRILKYHGNKEERAAMRATGEVLDTSQWDVMVTSYEMGIKEKALLHKIQWDFIVVDEAHRLKNENSLLSQVLRFFSSKSRLLITGTPLQNNLHELWALLNFLLPNIFASSEEFDAMFKASEQNSTFQDNILTKLHAVLKPFMLRRLKQQVEGSLLPKKETLIYVGMSEMQMQLYKSVLFRDLDTLFGKTKEKTRLLNTVMQLRKAANHPYLFEGVEDRTLPPYGEHLVTVSGKVTVLDKLLVRLKEQGSRVLIFSQMTRTVDILEDYCIYRQFKYCRIDGSTTQTDREQAMKTFNEPDSEKFIFLLSTRAGGLGINLATADIVILYDSDWNPQMDLQAQDRAHRIGQKKQVCVYRFVTEYTVEEKIIERAEIKLRLDAMVIQSGKLQQAKSTNAMSKEDMTAMIRFGADRIMKARGGTLLDEDITAILSRGEQKTMEIQKSMEKKVTGLMDFALDGEASLIQTGEVDLDEDELRHSCELMDKINAIGKRERKSANYDVNQYYKDALKHGGTSLIARPIKIPKFFDYQFFDRERIEELSEKERTFYEKYQWSDNPPALRGITAEEEAELKQLLSEGFPDWTRPQYNAFVAGVKRFGSQNIEKLHSLLPMKTLEQVQAYHARFMTRMHTLPYGQHLIAKVARADARATRFGQMESTLETFLHHYPTKHDTMEKLSIKYKPLQKGKGFTPAEDRIILYETAQIGYGNWKRLKRKIHEDHDFRFDYFLLSRNSTELNRRCDALLRLLGKDIDETTNTTSTKKKSKHVEMSADGFGSGFGNVKDRGSDDHYKAPKKPRQSKPKPKPILQSTTSPTTTSAAHATTTNAVAQPVPFSNTTQSSSPSPSPSALTSTSAAAPASTSTTTMTTTYASVSPFNDVASASSYPTVYNPPGGYPVSSLPTFTQSVPVSSSMHNPISSPPHVHVPTPVPVSSSSPLMSTSPTSSPVSDGESRGTRQKRPSAKALDAMETEALTPTKKPKI